MTKSPAVLAVLLLFGVSVAPTAASRPTFEVLDVGGPFTLTGVCPFDIYEEPLRNKEKIATFYGESGNITFQIISGVNKWRFTNLSTNKSLDINASGPGRLTVQPDSATVRLEGGGVSFFYIPNPPPGIPNYALTSGRLVADLDLATFEISQVQAQHGTVQDICALLQ